MMKAYWANIKSSQGYVNHLFRDFGDDFNVELITFGCANKGKNYAYELHELAESNGFNCKYCSKRNIAKKAKSIKFHPDFKG